MVGKTNNTACAITIQAVAGTFDEPSQPDELMLISGLRANFTPITIANDEYTGSVIKNADDVVGSRKSFSFNVKLRPPSTLPAANAFNLGKLLQACKMTEVRDATGIAAEAEGGSSTTTAANLGTSAGTTDDQYIGYPLIISDNGTGYKNQITSIIDYVGSTKLATLPETLGSAPAANVAIPPFIGYMRSVNDDDPIVLSMQFWLDGFAYDMRDMRVTSAQLVFPTSTRDQGAYPELQVTVEGILDDYYDEATPSISAGGAIPLFKDGDMMLNRVPIGGSTFTVDLGISTENPPNPNETDGSDAPEMVESVARITQTRQRYSKATIDTLGLSEAQTYVPFWAQYGSGGGSFVQVGAPQVRLAPPTPDMGGNFINEQGDLLIDATDRGVFIVFPMALA